MTDRKMALFSSQSSSTRYYIAYPLRSNALLTIATLCNDNLLMYLIFQLIVSICFQFDIIYTLVIRTRVPRRQTVPHFTTSSVAIIKHLTCMSNCVRERNRWHHRILLDLPKRIRKALSSFTNTVDNILFQPTSATTSTDPCIPRFATSPPACSKYSDFRWAPLQLMLRSRMLKGYQRGLFSQIGR